MDKLGESTPQVKPSVIDLIGSLNSIGLLFTQLTNIMARKLEDDMMYISNHQKKNPLKYPSLVDIDDHDTRFKLCKLANSLYENIVDNESAPSDSLTSILHIIRDITSLSGVKYE